MSKQELLEKLALEYKCPRCAAQPHFRCQHMTKGYYKYLRHPHPARMTLMRYQIAKEAEDGRSGR